MDKIAICIAKISTARLGTVWAAASERGLTTVEFGVSRAAFESTVRHQLKRSIVDGPARAQEIADNAVCQIEEYLLGKRRQFDIPIDWSILSSDFQRIALKAVMAIPCGAFRTYGEIAAQIGYPRAPRAVGRANATNPMPLVIPCHRVIGSDGKLHGYGGYGGLKTKQWLLDFEGAAVPAP
jgi:methylated-DNA-[protein]-cysteine S-methyltransferase